MDQKQREIIERTDGDSQDGQSDKPDRTLAGNELGKNFVLGICVSVMALAFDHVIMRWVAKRKAALGL